MGDIRTVHAFPLVPLSIGEIFDRAITIVVRAFVPLAAIFLVYVVPLAILRYIAVPDQTLAFGSLATIMTHPNSPEARAAANVLQHQRSSNWITGVLLILSFAVWPVIDCAAAVVVAAIYRGETMDVRDAFRRVLGRWLPAVGVTFFGLCAAIPLVIVGFLGIVAITLVAIAISAGLHLRVVAAVVAIVLALVLVIVLLLAGSLVLVAYQLGLIDVALGETNPITALAAGFRRTFARAVRKRSLLFGIALVAVTFGASFVQLAAVGVLAQLVHSTIAAEAVSSVLSVIASIFITAVFTVYYLDVRIRREGLDLREAIRE